jgi:hypothetical protein
LLLEFSYEKPKRQLFQNCQSDFITEGEKKIIKLPTPVAAIGQLNWSASQNWNAT